MSIAMEPTGPKPLDIDYDAIEFGFAMGRAKTGACEAKLGQLEQRMALNDLNMTSSCNRTEKKLKQAQKKLEKYEKPSDVEYKGQAKTIADIYNRMADQATQEYCQAPPPIDKTSGYFDLDKTQENATLTMSVHGKPFDVTTTCKPKPAYSRWDVPRRCPDCGLQFVVLHADDVPPSHDN